MLCLGGKRCSLSLMCDMGEQERSRINFCAKVFKAFGLNLTLLVDHRVVYQVGNRGSVIALKPWSVRRNRCCSIDRSWYDV